MKNWIKVIFALNNRLDALTYSIDEQVDSLSSVLTVPTMKLFDRIIKLNDKKVKIINLRVLHDKMKENLNAKEYCVVSRSSRGVSFADIAKELNVSKGSAYRIYERVINRLTRLLAYYGYDENKFAEDYKDVALVARTHKRLSKTAQAS